MNGTNILLDITDDDVKEIRINSADKTDITNNVFKVVDKKLALPINLNDIFNTETCTLLKREIIAATNAVYASINADAVANGDIKKTTKADCKEFDEVMTAKLLVLTDDFRFLRSVDGKASMLLVRRRDEEGSGTWEIQKNLATSSTLLKASTRINAGKASDEKFLKKVIAHMSTICKEADDRCFNNRTVFCKNGVWDFKDKSFTPYLNQNGGFTDKFLKEYSQDIRTTKLAVNYNPNAANHVFTCNDGTEWSVDGMLNGMSLDGNPLFAKCMLEITHFAIRGVSGGRYWIISNSGNGAKGGGGKGVFTESIESIIGYSNVAHVAIEEMDKDFRLGCLVDSSCIISHESDASTETVEKSSVFKNLCRSQPININEKGEKRFDFVFRGAGIFEINGDMKFKEKTDSVFRKSEVLRFERQFTKNGDHDVIKDVYSKSDTALEYLLLLVLQMDCLDEYSKDVLAYVKPNKEGLKRANNPVFAFMDELAPTFASKSIPIPMLYEVFTGYNAKLNGVTRKMRLIEFKENLSLWCEDSNEWNFVPSSTPLKWSKTQIEPEFMLSEYGHLMEDQTWLATQRNGSQPDVNTYGKVATSKIGKSLRGFIVRTKTDTSIITEKDNKNYMQFKIDYMQAFVQYLAAGTTSFDNIPSITEWVVLDRPMLGVKKHPKANTMMAQAFYKNGSTQDVTFYTNDNEVMKAQYVTLD